MADETVAVPRDALLAVIEDIEHTGGLEPDVVRAAKRLRACLPPQWSDAQCEAFYDALYTRTEKHPRVEAYSTAEQARAELGRLHEAGWKVEPPEHLRGET